jgi:hypothetical protein
LSNPVKKVDEFFSVIIEDGAGRFFCLHLPFWGLVGIVGWHVIEALGLFLIWGGIVFLLIPGLSAWAFQGLCEQEQFSEDKGAIQVAVGVYAAAVLAMTGIPGWYFGFALQGIQTQAFSDAYWAGIVYWWRFFNFYRNFKSTKAELKEAQAFLNHYQFSYQTWQVLFLISAMVVTPLLFWWIHNMAVARARSEELEHLRLLKEAEEKKAREDAYNRTVEERQRQHQERRLKEEQAEKEKQRKIQEKFNEIKGKDPWDSGFL